MGYKRLQGVSRGVEGVRGFKVFKGLQGITGDYKE